MKFVTVPVAVLVLGLSLGPAHAFQETTIGASPTPKAAAKATDGQSAVGGADGSAILTPSQKKAAAKPKSGGIQFPGLSDFGLLPKMNFGLELLYGQGDVREPVTNPQDAPIDDLTIRGSVKHNF